MIVAGITLIGLAAAIELGAAVATLMDKSFSNPRKDNAIRRVVAVFLAAAGLLCYLAVQGG